jgi:hypothetical protein
MPFCRRFDYTSPSRFHRRNGVDDSEIEIPQKLTGVNNWYLFQRATASHLDKSLIKLYKRNIGISVIGVTSLSQQLWVAPQSW